MVSGKSDLIDVAGTIVVETEKAYRFDYGGRDSVWLPKSQCEYDKDAKVMTTPEWLAIEKGIS